MRADVRGGHAVVVGASFAGLLAARVLSEHVGWVTLLEREAGLPPGPVPRLGVPHGRHAHGLLARGREVLEELFPGLTDELVAHGAVTGDLQDRMRWTFHGRALARGTSDLQGLMVSRGLLEHALRGRALALPNVSMITGAQVRGLAANGDRVTGVLLDGCVPTVPLTADLVVDASGRTSRLPEWLRAMGRTPPEEERVQVDVGYTTRTFTRTVEDADGDLARVWAASQDVPRGGALIAQEGDRWIVSLSGRHGLRAPLELEGFCAYAGALDPTLERLLRTSVPLDEGAFFRFSANVRRRYERLRDLPDGLVAIGDSVCSFNPVFGQGMTVAAGQALVLAECLADGLDGVGRRFFAATRPVVDVPWRIAVGSDRQKTGTHQRPGRLERGFNRYLASLRTAAHRDPMLARAFLHVVNLQAAPTSLLAPRTVARVVWPRRGRGVPKTRDVGCGSVGPLPSCDTLRVDHIDV